MVDVRGADSSRSSVSQKSLEQGRNMLSALFMGIRTARLHQPGNQAFSRAVEAVHRAASELHMSTGGFSIKFVEDSVFLNRARLRFESGAFSTIRQLREMLETEDLGGIEM